MILEPIISKTNLEFHSLTQFHSKINVILNASPYQLIKLLLDSHLGLIHLHLRHLTLIKKEMKGELEREKMGPDSRGGPPKDKTSIEEVVNQITEKPTTQYFFMLLGLMSFNLVRILPN